MRPSLCRICAIFRSEVRPAHARSPSVSKLMSRSGLGAASAPGVGLDVLRAVSAGGAVGFEAGVGPGLVDKLTVVDRDVELLIGGIVGGIVP